MDRKQINVGSSNFKNIISSNSYYIDKTLLIEGLLNKKSKVLLITRPRRFGKTMNMTMLKYFFDIKNRENNRELFRGLNIEKTKYMSEQGKYPVIFFTMEDLSGLTYEEYRKTFNSEISKLFNNHSYLKEMLNGEDLESFNKIYLRKEDGKYTEGLRILIRLLNEYHGIKPILLIENYDRKKIEEKKRGYYEEVQNLISIFFDSVFKEENLTFAVITGVFRADEESIFQSVDDLEVSTILSEKYKYFGMNDEDVIKTLKYYGLESNLEDVKKWYDGYLFGKDRVYNPLSILKYCNYRKLEDYWIETNNNSLTREILKNASIKLLDIIYQLIKNGEILVRLDDYTIFREEFSDNSLIYLMFSAGYLTVKNKGEKNGEYYLTIPNFEVKSFLSETLRDIATSVSLNRFSKLEESLISGDVPEMKYILDGMFQDSITYQDIFTEGKFYRNLVIGILVGMNKKFYVHSNRESGFGRYDLALEPVKNKSIGYIFESKVATSKKEMDSLGKEALTQIDWKQYEVEFRDRGVQNIQKVGMVFYEKEMKIYI